MDAKVPVHYETANGWIELGHLLIEPKFEALEEVHPPREQFERTVRDRAVRRFAGDGWRWSRYQMSLSFKHSRSEAEWRKLLALLTEQNLRWPGPPPMPAGMVTWPSRSRRKRRGRK